MIKIDHFAICHELHDLRISPTDHFLQRHVSKLARKSRHLVIIVRAQLLNLDPTKPLHENSLIDVLESF